MFGSLLCIFLCLGDMTKFKSICLYLVSLCMYVGVCVCWLHTGRWHMKRLPSCSFIFFSAVVWPGRGAVVTSPWKIELYAAAGSHRHWSRQGRMNSENGKKRKISIGGCRKGRCGVNELVMWQMWYWWSSDDYTNKVYQQLSLSRSLSWFHWWYHSFTPFDNALEYLFSQ